MLKGISSIEIVYYLVTCVPQSRESSVLHKVMNMTNCRSGSKNRVTAQYSLHRQIERDMEYFIYPFFPNTPEKSKIILDVLKYVNRHQNINDFGTFAICAS